MKIQFDLGQGMQEIDRVGISDMVAFERHFQLPATVMEPETELVTDEHGAPVQDIDDNGRLLFDDAGQPINKIRILGEQRMEWIAFLVWRSAKRQGLTNSVAFDDDFLDSIVDFAMVAEAEDSAGEGTAAATA